MSVTVQRDLPMPPFVLYEDFLAPEEHAAMLALVMERQEKFKPTKLRGDVVKPDVRRSTGTRLNERMHRVFDGRLRERTQDLIAALGVESFTPGAIELNIAAHNDGDFFRVHIDLSTGGEDLPETPRRISTVYYFYHEPKAFEGGELRLFRFGTRDPNTEFIEIEPAQNRLVAFPSWAPHEVRPIACPSGAFADSRFSVNGWIHGTVS